LPASTLGGEKCVDSLAFGVSGVVQFVHLPPPVHFRVPGRRCRPKLCPASALTLSRTADKVGLAKEKPFNRSQGDLARFCLIRQANSLWLLNFFESFNMLK
jgi:hypothetical protein